MTHYDSNIFATDGGGQTTKQRIGLVAGLLRGDIQQIEYGPLTVTRCGQHGYVEHRAAGRVGGNFSLEHADVRTLVDHFERKIAYYGGNNGN